MDDQLSLPWRIGRNVRQPRIHVPRGRTQSINSFTMGNRNHLLGGIYINRTLNVSYENELPFVPGPCNASQLTESQCRYWHEAGSTILLTHPPCWHTFKLRPAEFKLTLLQSPRMHINERSSTSKTHMETASNYGTPPVNSRAEAHTRGLRKCRLQRAK
jgi:hypothetical protein